MQRIQAHRDQLHTNVAEKDLLLQAISGFNPDTHICQGCGACGFMKISSTYRRGFTTVIDNGPADDSIMIPCSRCDSCGGYYHAILPDILIPFSSYTLLFVLTVLESYVNRACTVAELCNYWSISVPTLYNWKHRFLIHHDLWMPALERIRAYHLVDQRSDHLSDCDRKHRVDTPAEHSAIRHALRRIISDIRSIRDFFLRFLFSFLQGNEKTHLKKLFAKWR